MYFVTLDNALGKWNDKFGFSVTFKEITVTHKRDKKNNNNWNYS